MSKGRLTVQFFGDTKHLRKSLREVEDNTGKTAKKLRELGREAKLWMGTVAAKAAIQFGKELWDLAALSEGVGNRVNQVFGNMAGDVREWADDQNEAFGTSADGVMKMAAELGDLLIPMGFARDAAAGMTMETLEAANALSEWTGGAVSTETAAEAVTKAMLGERDMLKQLGISLMETDISQRLAAKGQKELTGEALAQATAIATQELIFEKSADALAAYAGEGNKALRAQKDLTAQLAEQKQQLADELLPTLLAAVEGAASFADGVRVIVDWYKELPESSKTAVTAIGGVTLALAAVMANPVVAGLAIVAGAVAAIGARAKESEESVADLTAELRGGEDAVRDWIDAQLDSQEVKGRLEELVDGYGDVREAARQYGITDDEMTDLVVAGREKIDAWHQRELEGIVAREGLLGSVFSQERDQLVQISRFVAQKAAEYEKAQRALQEFTSESNRARLRSGEMTFQQGQLNEELAEAPDRLDAVSEGLSGMAGTLRDDLMKELEDFLDFFSGMPEQMEVDLDEFQRVYDARLEQMSLFQESLVELERLGLDGLAAEIREQGPKAAAVAAAYVADVDAAMDMEARIDAQYQMWTRWAYQGAQAVLDAETVMRAAARQLAWAAADEFKAAGRASLLDDVTMDQLAERLRIREIGLD